MMGAMAGLAASLFYVGFVPKDIFGLPEPIWARCLFFPGTVVGLFTYENVTHDLVLCTVAGGAAMVAVGGFLGFCLGLLLNDSPLSSGE